MKPLTERMTKGGAAKSWIKEVEAKDREILDLEQIKVQYLSIINLLAYEKEQLEAENEALSELLSPLVDVELERDKLEAKLTAIECGDCGKTMLTCGCDDVENG